MPVWGLKIEITKPQHIGVSSNFVDTYIVIKCYQFEVQKVGYFCNNFVTIEVCIISKLDSVESQNKK